MKADRIRRLVENELSCANDEQMLDCLYSAEHLIKACIDAPASADDLVLFEGMLEDVQGRIRKHCL